MLTAWCIPRRTVFSVPAAPVENSADEIVALASAPATISSGSTHPTFRSAAKATTQRAGVRRAAVPSAITSKAATTHPAVTRSATGRIQRSEAARHAFARQTGYPNGRPAYVIDHIKPLACGGADAVQHAVADDCRCEGEGQDGAHRLQMSARKHLLACLVVANLLTARSNPDSLAKGQRSLISH
jgi:hypothetical protein